MLDVERQLGGPAEGESAPSQDSLTAVLPSGATPPPHSGGARRCESPSPSTQHYTKQHSNGSLSTRVVEQEARRYESVIVEQYGGIELLLAAVGDEGTIGRNEPGSSLTSSTRIKVGNVLGSRR
jgi:hypothetical protein